MIQKTFAELFGQKAAPKRLSRGLVVDAKILSLTPNSILVDIGAKSEAVVTGTNFSENREFIRTLKVGDTVRVLVTGQEAIEGLVQVSLKPAASGFVWEQLARARDKKEAVKARVTERGRGGLEVNVWGISSFIPNSQLGKQLQNAADTTGRSISVMVLSADRSKNQLVLSERAISEKDQIERQIEVLAKLTPGEIMDGKVANVVPFGAFVEVAKDNVTLTGLVHKSEVSWNREQELEPGQGVKVTVLGVKDANLSLSVKRAGSDPWQDAENLTKDSPTAGTVVRTTERNIIVEVMPGVEGTIARSKLPAGSVPEVGERISCLVENIDIAKHRLSLSPQLTAKPIGYK